MLICAMFTVAQAHVFYSRTHWVWINVEIYCLCFLASLLSIIYNPNTYLYSMALLGPLIGLFILNSSRCREMRHTMVQVRRKREDIIATLKKQGKWKGWQTSLTAADSPLMHEDQM